MKLPLQKGQALASAVRTGIAALLILFSLVCSVATNPLFAADQKAKRKPRASGPALSPASPAVTPGNSITITSASPVTWSLKGVGVLSNQTSTSVTYTAPSSVVAQNQMLGCPVLPNDTIFNTRVDNLPLDANSANMIASQSTSPIRFEPSWGISYADNSTPTRTLLTYYGVVSHPNFVFPNQGPNMKRESGDYVGTFQFSNPPDHHIMTVKRTDCTFYESYDDYLNGYLRTCNDGVTANCNVQSAVSYASTSYNYGSNWGTDAAGLLLAPLTWHLDEIKSGVINHAVRFTEGTGGIQFGTFRWPATATAGGCAPCSNSLPMGTRLRLKSSYNIGTFSPTAQTLLTALKNYGMFLSDTGSNNAIQVLTDVSEDPTVSAALSEIGSAGVGISNFEVVDESSLQFAAGSYAVCPINTTCLGAANTYVSPVSQAMITATPSSGAATSIPVAIQGIGIGLGVPSVLPIQAGTYNFQIPFWVNGTSNQTVNWSLVSGVGSVTTAGLYTPPTSTSSNSATASAVLKGTSAADPNVNVSLYLTVLPSGASPTGSIRIDSGATVATTDGKGYAWLPEIGAEGINTMTTSDYPNWSTTSSQRIVYQSASFGYANDLHYNIAMPNGNYKVHLLFGLPFNGCGFPCGSWPGKFGQEIHTYNPQILETQGTIQAHYFDWGATVGYAYGQPADVYIPAKVTNNLLEIGLMAMAPDVGTNLAPQTGNKFNGVNGIEIIPDTIAPHWAIDTQQQTTISPGQTLKPFYVTDWYTGVNDPVWSIVSGPPGATLNGSTLSLGSGTYLNGQAIVVRANDANYSATATIYTAGGKSTALAITGIPPVVNHYAYKRPITIDHTQVSANLSNFPITLSISDSALSNVTEGGHVQEIHGYDIIFTSDAAGVNKLNWEVESYDSNLGTWLGHVSVPALSHTTDTVIYAFYGNPAIKNDQSNAAGVWDGNYSGVYHFTTVSATTTGDSTANANNAISNNLIALSPSGKIGSGATFGGSGSAYHLEFPAAVLNAPSGTISAWVNSNIAMSTGQNYAAADTAESGKEFHFLQWSTFFNGTLFGWNSGTADYTITVPTSKLTIPVNTWSHIAYTWNQASSTQVVYLNGVAVNTVTSAFTPYAPTANFWLGTDPLNASYAFGGLMDEVRLSGVNRSASWLATEFANQNAPSTFAALGSEASN